LRIGIAGTGRMGTAIARRLLGFGHAVTVWNRTPRKSSVLAGAGASIAATPAAVTRASDIIITILTDSAAMEAVYKGSEGLLAGEPSGRLFLEMSTVRPQPKKVLANEVRAKNAAFIDCPVGGTVGPATEGKLLGLAGGDEGDIARARPVLDQLCRRVEHVGPVGAGAAVKLAMNLTSLVYWQSFGEALALCKPLGLEPARLMELFAESSGAPKLFQRRAKDVAATLEGKDIAPVNFDIDSVRKDLRTMIEEADAIGCKVPVAERALECFDHASREGLGSKDCATLPAIWWRRTH
jgi:3-hydroxyisobutyrate dehydrogenase